MKSLWGVWVQRTFHYQRLGTLPPGRAGPARLVLVVKWLRNQALRLDFDFIYSTPAILAPLKNGWQFFFELGAISPQFSAYFTS
jgi:hypothetical protein